MGIYLSQTLSISELIHVFYLFYIFTFIRYVITDVLLLADVLEKYRAMCWTRMGLEALRYVSLPALTFDACLKITRQKVQIVKDIDILQFIESGIRGQN